MAVVILSALLFSQEKPQDTEARVARAKGKEKIKLLSELARDYQQNDPKKSLEYAKEAIKLLDTFPDKRLQAHILNSMCAVSFHIGDYRTAKDYARKSLSIAEEIDDIAGQAQSRLYLGDVSMQLGEFDHTLDHYTKGLELYKKLDDKKGMARAYNQIGLFYMGLSDLPGALQYFQNALKIHEELNNIRGIASVSHNLGALYWHWKNADKSLEYLRKSLEFKKKFDNKSGIAVSLLGIGVIYRNNGDHKTAIEYYNRALNIYKEIGNKSSIATIFNNFGEIYRELKDYKKALEYFNRALKIKEDLQEKKGISRMLINACAMNRMLGRHEESLRQARRALAIAKEIDVKDELKDSYLEVSESLEAMKNHKEALDYYKKYHDVNESIFNDENIKRIENLNIRYEVEQKKREVDLLRKDTEIQKSLTVFLIIFSCLILVVAFLLFARYRLKTRTTRELQKEVEERKRTEIKLRESEEKFRVLAEKSVVGICIIQDNTIKYANPTLSKIFGYSPEEIIDKTPLEMAFEEDTFLVSENLDKLMAGKNGASAYEFRGYTKSGQIIEIESYGALTQYNGQPAILETIIDITERKKAEMEIQKIRKLESIGILAGGIAHDFNNLLTVIIGNITLAKSNLEREINEPRNQTLLENAEKASYQAADLAQKFIMFSKGSWISPQRITLFHILRDAISLYPQLEELRYNFSFPEDLHPMKGDERQLKQVFSNLLLNASEAIADLDNEITVEAENAHVLEENTLLLKEGDYVKILIIDKGKGIPSHHMERIFDPYFSTKNTVSQRGLGMGLAICYAVVKKHGGYISINSEPEKGTTVELYLPAFV